MAAGVRACCCCPDAWRPGVWMSLWLARGLGVAPLPPSPHPDPPEARTVGRRPGWCHPPLPPFSGLAPSFAASRSEIRAPHGKWRSPFSSFMNGKPFPGRKPM